MMQREVPVLRGALFGAHEFGQIGLDNSTVGFVVHDARHGGAVDAICTRDIEPHPQVGDLEYDSSFFTHVSRS